MPPQNPPPPPTPKHKKKSFMLLFTYFPWFCFRVQQNHVTLKRWRSDFILFWNSRSTLFLLLTLTRSPHTAVWECCDLRLWWGRRPPSSPGWSSLLILTPSNREWPCHVQLQTTGTANELDFLRWRSLIPNMPLLFSAYIERTAITQIPQSIVYGFSCFSHFFSECAACLP